MEETMNNVGYTIEIPSTEFTEVPIINTTEQPVEGSTEEPTDSSVEDHDPSKGEWQTKTIIVPNGKPIDNITKFAYDNDEYVEVKEWHEYTEEELAQIEGSKAEQRKQEAIDNIVASQDDVDLALCELYEQTLSQQEELASQQEIIIYQQAVIEEQDAAVCELYELIVGGN